MQRSKLCYVIRELRPGTPTHYYHLYEFLEELGREVDLFLVVESRRVGEVPSWAAKYYFQRLTWAPLRMLELVAILTYARIIGYTRFYTHYSFFGGLAAGLLSRLAGGESNYWHCGRPGDYFIRPMWKAPGIYLREEVPLRLILRLTRYLVTGNQTSARYYQSQFGLAPDQVRIVPNWVNLDRFNPPDFPSNRLKQELEIPEGARTCLFVHRVSMERGADQLVPLAKLVCQEEPRALFVVVGEGPYMRRLREEIAEAGLAAAFHLAGWIPNQQVARYYALADVFISPATRAGFPRNLLEAMAMSVPVVATDVGGIREVLGPELDPCIVRRGCLEEFARRVIRFLADPAASRIMGEAGRRRAQTFSLSRVVKEFQAQVLGGNTGKGALAA